MERRRTDRKEQLANILPLVWYSTQVPITRILTPCAEVCANPVRNPGTGTRKILSSHDLYFGLVFLAVNGLQERVLAYLQEAEYREPDAWHRQDYRTAQTILVLADEGAANPYSKAFRQLFGKNAHEVRFWWRDRAKLFAICEIANSPHPLCHPDIGRRLPDEIVPDYDYSQVSSGGAHAERKLGTSSPKRPTRPVGAARQSGPLGKVSARVINAHSLPGGAAGSAATSRVEGRATSPVIRPEPVFSGGAKGATSPRPDEGRRCSHVADPAVRVVRRSDSPLERISPVHPTPRAHVHPAKDPASAPIEPTGAGTPRRTA